MFLKAIFIFICITHKITHKLKQDFIYNLGGKIVNDEMLLYMDIERHLLQDTNPSNFIKEIVTNDIFSRYPFTMLKELINIPQSPKYHPEGSAWNHTLLVVNMASQNRRFSENPKVFMWSALLHDIGKITTTKIKKGKITSYNHDVEGAILAREFLENFIDDNEFIKEVCSMIRWHMQILFVSNNLTYSDIKTMLSEVSINEISLLALCDRLGRGKLTFENEKKERKNIKTFKEKCRKIHRRK